MKNRSKSSLRLNKFMAHSGVCNRREADELIKQGAVKVNGRIVVKLGITIDPMKDTVEYRGRILSGGGFLYLLLNKSKGYGKEGKTVSQLIRGAADVPLTQIGELGVNDLGLVLFTNDPDMAARISTSRDPKLFLYHIKLKKAIDEEVLNDLKSALLIGSQNLVIGDITLIDEAKGFELGLTTNCAEVSCLSRLIHSVGVTVDNIERVIFSGITKKDVPRGKWRLLSAKEAAFLKMI